MAYKYRPKNKEELIKAIKKEIFEIQGTPDNPNWKADLNCIDTSNVTDMSDLFSEKYGFEKFDGEISNWNVSNVYNMNGMFYKSKFNQDISEWDVGNVENMSSMFEESKFNRDISKWNVSNVKVMIYMFAFSEFNRDISNWDVSNVKNMSWMFENSRFNQDIGSWPFKLKKETELKNISISLEYNKLPDKIVCPETVANIFIRSINNPDNTFNIDNFKQIFKGFLNNRKELYKSKSYKSNIIKKLILNDIIDILKQLKDKDMQDKLMKITMSKKNIEITII